MTFDIFLYTLHGAGLPPGLFLAGQINGTTGYEEAAAQGLVAGAHAAARAMDLCNPRTGVVPHLQCVLDRTQSYLGVMVDDLTSLGVTEPYRMFTSRAEFRAFLRPDNADVRLTAAGHKCGLVSARRWAAYSRMSSRLEEMRDAAANYIMPLSQWRHKLRRSRWPSGDQCLEDAGHGTRSRSALDLLGAHDVPGGALSAADAARFPPPLWTGDVPPDYGGPSCAQRLRVERVYAHVLQRAEEQARAIRRAADVHLPLDLDYDQLQSLSFEARQALQLHRPATLAALSRVPGVTSSDALCVHHWLRRLQRRREAAARRGSRVEVL